MHDRCADIYRFKNILFVIELQLSCRFLKTINAIRIKYSNSLSSKQAPIIYDHLSGFFVFKTSISIIKFICSFSAKFERNLDWSSYKSELDVFILLSLATHI